MKNESSLLRITLGILVGVLLNIGPMYLVQYVLKWPLFMDTLGSISVAFIFGGIPAIICALLSEFAMFAIEHYLSVIVIFYGFSVWAAIGVVCIFRKRIRKSESLLSVLIILFIISILMTVVVSVVGGIVNCIDISYQSYAGIIGESNSATSLFQNDLLKMGFNSLATTILSRIPGNLIERPITTFLAFGITFVYSKLQRKFSK